MKLLHTTWIALVVLASLAGSAVAADRTAVAVRRDGPIHVDGHLDEAAWSQAPSQEGFWQRAPKEGDAPHHRTEFRVVYDDAALYVGVRAWDDHSDAIRQLLHRRDQDSDADWVAILIDSYHDRRTAFGFAINAAGVQRDLLMYDDVAEDQSWDAVWTGGATVDDRGWTAEFRIPLGQLRFSSDPHQQWGLQVMRQVGRDGEQTLWSPSPKAAQGFVSNFGVLDGLEGLRPSRRLEVLPYATAGLGRAATDAGDPFHGAVDPRANLGVDVRYGLTSAMTLSATINPDFGQVEADPSQVNLTANETFFPEKRPFFLEGVDIFQFGLGQGDGPNSTDSLFYSRRIGGPPHGDIDGAYVDVPIGTSIYGAAKVSGKTASGWSIGVLEAVTAEESATADDGAGTRSHAVVEPLTSYTLARIKKDLRDGRTSVGAALTDVARRLDGTGLEDTLHDQAVTGGVQVDHKWGEDDRWALSARLAGTWVHGTPAALLDTQTSFRHLYQRPDAEHIEVDPTRTSLTGAALVGSVGRYGKHWRVAVGSDVRSPGFEGNDLGYHGPVDYFVEWGWLQYRDDEPGDRLLSYSLNANAWTYGTAAPELAGYGGNVNGNAQFTNFWSVSGGVNLENNALDPGALRGGPALRGDTFYGVWGNLSSDGRKAVSAQVSVNLGRHPTSDGFNGAISGGVDIQARPNVELFVGPSYSVNVDDHQYVAEVGDGSGLPHYLFAKIRQRTVGLTVRGSWTFTPDLSLQVYAQPFVAAGAYQDLKQAAATRADDYDDRFTVYGADQITRVDDVYLIDDDRDGAADYAVGVPDFDFRELRSTVVLRWQYRPGSTVFFIWNQGRSDTLVDGHLDVGRDLRGLIAAPAEHVVMVKANYWFGL